MKCRTSLVLLGTGNPNPDPSCSGPSSAVVVDDTAYIIDAGPGVVRRASRAYQNGIESLRADRLDKLFLTHLHSDHTIGLPDLILTPWVIERKEPLTIWGPTGTKNMCKHILKAYEEDINVRRRGLERADPSGVEVNVHEIKEGLVFEDERVKVDAFRVLHGAWEHAFGFRFRTPDRTIIISGDCSPTPDMIENYRGADILLHEVYSEKGFRRRSDHWKAYHRSSHTSAKQLGEIASKVRPGKLVLHHTMLFGASEEDLLREISDQYDGEIILGHDLDVI
ncbi:MAG: MBL fold metallo-hydrolase [Candidatus Thermoplasmatota archaeon]|nr:MBL fold metallo-hydrolase [Candidatus Thermoplasmatota archaeon]